jgi:hypothetical protein
MLVSYSEDHYKFMRNVIDHCRSVIGVVQIDKDTLAVITGALSTLEDIAESYHASRGFNSYGVRSDTDDKTELLLDSLCNAMAAPGESGNPVPFLFCHAMVCRICAALHTNPVKKLRWLGKSDEWFARVTLFMELTGEESGEDDE